MTEKNASRHSWLFIRNKAIATVALISGAIAILFGFRTWWDILWVMPFWLICLSIWQMVQGVHPRRPAIIRRTTPAEFGLENYEEVFFSARDGLNIFAYYLKGSRPEAIILAHGAGGGGVAMSAHGRFLQKAGFPVLMLDLRAHAHSEGNTIDGIQELNDILGAVDYIRTRPELDPQRIGALGISLGARTLLHATLQTDAIRALVLEGLGPMNLEDHGGRPTTLRRWINYPINWLTYNLGDWIAGTSPASNSSALVSLRRPLLYISSGHNKEQHFNRLLFAAASEPKEFWEIPGTRHAAGYFKDNKAYAGRVVAFFESNLT